MSDGEVQNGNGTNGHSGNGVVDPTLNPLNGGNFVRNNKRWIDGGPLLKRFSLAGKTAIITGGGAGIGYSVALAYAEMGCNIAIWYNSNPVAIERAEALAKQYHIQCKSTAYSPPLVLIHSPRQGVSGRCS